MDELRNNLLTYPDWGCVIYRTTYSAESNTLFPDAVRFIEGCIKQESSKTLKNIHQMSLTRSGPNTGRPSFKILRNLTGRFST